MKYLAIFLLIIARSASADQEFYLGDSTAYAQPSSGQDQSASKGTQQVPAGTYIDAKAGTLGQVALTVSDTEVRLVLPPDTETFTAAARQKFLSGMLVTLSSGRRIQFFRSFLSPGEPRLLLYSPAGALVKSIDLIPKKT